MATDQPISVMGHFAPKRPVYMPKKGEDGYGNKLTPSALDAIVPNKAYIWGWQDIATPMADIESMFKAINPFDKEKLTPAEKILRNNKAVMLRAKTLTALKQLGVDVPGRLAISGFGSKAAKAVLPNVDAIVLLEIPEVMLMVISAMPSMELPPPEMKGWTPQHMYSYVMADGEGGYASYLQHGGTPIAILSELLDTVLKNDIKRAQIDAAKSKSEKARKAAEKAEAITEAKRAKAAGEAGGKDESPVFESAYIDDAGWISAPPEVIKRMKQMGRIVGLKAFIETYFAKINVHYLGIPIHELYQMLFSGSSRSGPKTRLIQIFRSLGIYLPSSVLFRGENFVRSIPIANGNLITLPEYMNRFAKFVATTQIQPNLTKAIIDLINELIDEMPPGWKKDRLIEMRNEPPADILKPTPPQDVDFDLRDAITKAINGRTPALQERFSEMEIKQSEGDRIIERIRNGAMSLIDPEASEADNIRVFGTIMDIIERILKSNEVEWMMGEPSQSGFHRYMRTVFSGLMNMIQAVVPIPERATRIATGILEWLFEGRPFFNVDDVGKTQPGETPAMPAKPEGGSVNGGSVKPGDSVKPPSATADQPPSAADEEGKHVIDTGSGIGWENRADDPSSGLGDILGFGYDSAGMAQWNGPGDIELVDIDITYNSLPGELNLSRFKRAARPTLDQAAAAIRNRITTAWRRITPGQQGSREAAEQGIEMSDFNFRLMSDEKASDSDLDTPASINENAEDVIIFSRALLRGAIILRSIAPGGDPSDPIYEIEIGGRRFRMRKKNMIWLLALLLGITALLAEELIRHAINTLENPDGAIDPDGKHTDDPKSMIPTGATVRDHRKIGGEAFVLADDDQEKKQQEAIWENFIMHTNQLKSQSMIGDMNTENKRDLLANVRVQGTRLDPQFHNLTVPVDSHPSYPRPQGLAPSVPMRSMGYRNVMQRDPYFNNIQENVYDNFTPLMPMERHLTAFENENSIYHDSAYNRQIRHPYHPVALGHLQSRQDGISYAQFSYATHGLLNEGNHARNSNIEKYPDMYGFAQNTRLDASAYRASRKR